MRRSRKNKIEWGEPTVEELLLHFLADEFRQGNSIIKLYCELLVGAMLADKPELRNTIDYECYQRYKYEACPKDSPAQIR